MIKRKVFSVFLCCLFMTACDENKEPDAPPPRVIKVFTPEPDIAQIIRVFPARSQARDNTDLAFKRAGQLDIRDGTPLKAWQILATLNDTDAKLRVRDRQTGLQLTEQQFQRVNTLAQRSAVSKFPHWPAKGCTTCDAVADITQSDKD